MSLGNHFPLPSSRTTMLLFYWLSRRLNRRRKIVFIGPPPIVIIDQLVERLCDDEHLIRPHARARERDHATDGGDALGLGLEHHQVERLLVMAARAASHQEGSGDALELSRRNICAGVALHALNRALNLRRLHRHSDAKTPGAVTLHAILCEDLANPQRP